MREPSGDLALLHKTIETRNWGGRIPRGLEGKRLAIHAGKTHDHDGQAQLVAAYSLEFDDVPMPRGAIIAVATVQAVRFLREEDALAALWPSSEIDPGRFGIFLKDIRALAEPVPCRGAQGFWTLPLDVERQMVSGVARG